MAESMKFGRVTTERGDIPDDEPVFVMRGADQVVPEALAVYWELCQSAGADPTHLDAIQAARERFVLWQHAHPERVKVPDTKDAEAAGPV